MLHKTKQESTPERPFESDYRQDIQAESFREIHNRFYPKIYDYSLCQTQDRAEAIQLSNSFFVKLAKNMTNLVQPEQTVRGMSNKVLEARLARKYN